MACTCWPIGVLELKVLLFTFRALGPASGRFVRVCAITRLGSYKYLYFHIPQHPTLLSRPLSSTHIVPFNATLKGTLFYLPIGPKVIPFWGSYLEFYKVIPKRNYFGAWYLVMKVPFTRLYCWHRLAPLWQRLPVDSAVVRPREGVG